MHEKGTCKVDTHLELGVNGKLVNGKLSKSLQQSKITYGPLAIWCPLKNFKNVKSTHGGVALLVTFQAEACNFTKSNTLPRVFLKFFKWFKW